MDKILITGNTGFVGRHVVQELLNHYSLRQLCLPSRIDFDLLNDSCDNLLKYCRYHGVLRIIHLASDSGGIGYNQNNQGQLCHNNLQMGINVLEVARQLEVDNLVMIGSTCSYPHTPKTIPFVEGELFDGMPESTNAGYGIAKRTLIKLGIEYNKQYGLNVVNLIPTNTYGPGDNFDLERSHVIPALIRKFEETGGRVEIWGDGSASRDFIFVKDLAQAIVLACKTTFDPQPINLGSGNEVSISDLISVIKEAGNYTADVIFDKSKPNGQPRRCLDISKAEFTLGWMPMTSLEEGLKQTIQWYRGHEKLNKS